MSSSKAKKERRLQRHLRNKRKDEEHKSNVWESGGLIEENHNNQAYSPERALGIADRLVEKLRESLETCDTNDKFVSRYQGLREWVRNVIVLWPAEVLGESIPSYLLLKATFENYIDSRETLLINFKQNIKEYYVRLRGNF